VAVAFALSAALLVFAICWWAWPHLPEPDRSAGAVIAKARFEKNYREARTPSDRVRVVAQYADSLIDRAEQQDDDAEKVAELARDFEQVVTQKLLVEAEAVPADQRAALLQVVARRLRHTNSTAEKLAVQWDGAGAAVASSWRDIARAARNADRKLQALART
jgi:hypothetical protein